MSSQGEKIFSGFELITLPLFMYVYEILIGEAFFILVYVCNS